MKINLFILTFLITPIILLSQKVNDIKLIVGIVAERNDRIFIIDITETVTNMIGITKPSDSIGKVIINP